MARETIGKMRANAAASTVFMNVVLDSFCNVTMALSMLALSMILPTMSSASFRISGVAASSEDIQRMKTSASFFTSFRGSPTASLSADITFGIAKPSCLGHVEVMLIRTDLRTSKTPTFTFHFPAAAAPRWASSTGSTIAGAALPRGPAFDSRVQISAAVPSGSDFSFTSSNSRRTAGKLGSTAGGFHSSARTVRRALSRVAALFIFVAMSSVAAWAILPTSSFTSLL
mmetsp:Transcript_50057/g.89949  ORF Transcript_50057/g.89949 Transcript_50057/m.89949 type:complete len:228 (+) Transcript_50057:567-1250(+)